MRKTIIALLLMSVAAGPALADKGGKGHGKGHGQHKEMKRDRGDRGGDDRGRQWRGSDDDRGEGWGRVDYRPVRVVAYDRNDRLKDSRKVWKERQKDRRNYAKEIRKDHRQDVREARREWREDHTRYVPVERAARYVPAPRYYERTVRHAEPLYYQQSAYRYALPAQRWTGSYLPIAGTDYAGDYGHSWPTSYSPLGPDFAQDNGASGSALLGGGGGLMSALLPVVVQSLFGGGTSNLGGLTGLGGLGGLGSGVDVLPLQQASYADPYGSGGDLSSMLLPALVGEGGSLF